MPNLTIPIRARVRKDISDVMLKTHWNNISECIGCIDEVMKKHHMFIDADGIDFSENSGYASLLIRAEKGYKYICSSCTEDYVFDNVLALSWCTVSSGKIEIIAYIS